MLVLLFSSPILDWVVAHHIVFEWPVYGTLIWSVSQKWAWLKAWFHDFNTKQNMMNTTTASVLKTADEARTAAVQVTKEIEVVSTNHLVHLQSSMDKTHEDLQTFAAALLDVHRGVANSLERQLDAQNRTLTAVVEGNRITGLLLDRSDRSDKKA
jgi:hypothetical protein